MAENLRPCIRFVAFLLSNGGGRKHILPPHQFSQARRLVIGDGALKRGEVLHACRAHGLSAQAGFLIRYRCSREQEHFIVDTRNANNVL